MEKTEILSLDTNSQNNPLNSPPEFRHHADNINFALENAQKANFSHRDVSSNEPNNNQKTSDSESPETKTELTVGEIRKLNAWKGDTKFGEFVEETLILPCKSFLSDKKWRGHLDPIQLFDIMDIVDYLDKKNLKINYIIDLNRSFDYYNFEEKKKDCPQLADTKYFKFKLENREVPDDDNVNKVYEVLKKAHEAKEVVVIHCFNGINRTGYIVADFLCRYFGIKGEEAIARFEKARKHRIEHQCMVDKLKERYSV